MADLSSRVENTSYIKIRINSLDPERPITFDLYVMINDRHVLYLRAGEKLDKEKIKSFETRKADVFFISEAERAVYKDYVHDRMASSELDPKKKAMILKESSFSLVEELFENPDVNTALQQSKEIINLFVDFIDKEEGAVGHLIGLSSHDFYTYNHSLDVSIYSLGLGRAAGYGSLRDLADLGQGALLHDIGKRNVPTELICKKGTLTDDEWAIMRMHPNYGLKIVTEIPGTSDSIKACIFEHHENFTGNGYPQQIPGPEIHPMAKIVAITDTYDALTTKRSYNEPITPTAALTMMKEKLAGRFDPDLLKCLYDVLFKLKSAS